MFAGIQPVYASTEELHTGDLWDKIGLVLVYIPTAAMSLNHPSHHEPAIPILFPSLFMRVGHPYVPRFKHFRRIFDLFVEYLDLLSLSPI